MILSAFAGIGGAMLVSDNGGSGIFSGDTSCGNASVGNITLTPSSSYTEDYNGVIYKSVSTVSESADGTATVADVAAAVKNSVVEIMTEYRSTGYFQYVTQGAGSGVIITSDGYIVTNNHVIADTDTGGLADTITVRLTDGTEYSARWSGTDSPPISRSQDLRGQPHAGDFRRSDTSRSVKRSCGRQPARRARRTVTNGISLGSRQRNRKSTARQ